MEAVILAGGLGTRLREILPEVPKPLAPINGKPFLEVLLSAMSRYGFSRVILSVGYKFSEIVQYFGNSFAGMEIVYVIEDSPMGTGGALRLAVEKCEEDHVFVLNGDTYLDLDYRAVEAYWEKCNCPIVVGKSVQDMSRFGGLKIDHSRVVGFFEKGMKGLGVINAGVYLFPVAFLKEIPYGEKLSLESDFIVNRLENCEIKAYITEGFFIDIGVPEDYFRAQRLLGD